MADTSTQARMHAERTARVGNVGGASILAQLVLLFEVQAVPRGHRFENSLAKLCSCATCAQDELWPTLDTERAAWAATTSLPLNVHGS